MSKLCIIGDLHSNYKRHRQICKDCEYTVQIGDLGFDYSYLKHGDIDPNKHKFFMGNHDRHDIPESKLPKHYLGKFGSTSLNGVEFFYLGGAWSIDWKYRTENVDWWRNEELSDKEFSEAEKIYTKAKPWLVLTHECPFSILPYVTNPDFATRFGYSSGEIRTKTNTFLEHLLSIHRPYLWCFGHFHRNWDRLIDKTSFVCIKDQDYLELEFDLEEINREIHKG